MGIRRAPARKGHRKVSPDRAWARVAEALKADRRKAAVKEPVAAAAALPEAKKSSASGKA
jgi:hypothetical protein